MIRWRVGDRVTLRYVPGLWRIIHIDAATYWLAGLDSFAKTFANLSPRGTVGVTSKEMILTPNDQETLL